MVTNCHIWSHWLLILQVYQKFLSVSTGLSDSALQSIAGQKRSANVEQSTGIYNIFIRLLNTIGLPVLFSSFFNRAVLAVLNQFSLQAGVSKADNLFFLMSPSFGETSYPTTFFGLYFNQFKHAL